MRTKHLPLWMLGGITLGVLNARTVKAQIIPDTTLPTNSSVVSGCKICTVTGGTERGVNLYHSFRSFSVPTGGEVFFSNRPQVENILMRVTGDSISDIDGLVRANGNANLFLLNPNGITFGPNARLNIGGSFVATTAASVQLPDGSEYSATNPQAPPLLAVNLVPGVQYGARSAGSTITNRGNLSAGKDLTLAADRLDLRGQLQAGKNLTLLAGDTVMARDSAMVPFVAAAGGNLLVQGDRGIDIAALSHPGSLFGAGGNLVLRSDSTVGGDARFSSVGNFTVERLDGSVGSLFSPNDPIILSDGDVTLGDYTGASLHVLAGGSVTLGNVTITGTGAVDSTINPGNKSFFNGSKTYADLASFNLTDYKATLNNDGSVKSVDPVAVPMTIDGSKQATLDVRSGVDWTLLGGLPTSPVIEGSISPLPLSGQASRADITVKGDIKVNEPAGLVLLTNQFSSNTLPGTITLQGNVNTSSSGVILGNGGDIRVYGQGDIAVGSIDPSKDIELNSSSTRNDVGSGNGGAISFATNSGNITNNSRLNSRSESSSRLDKTGNGGAISFATNSGNITLIDSTQYSYSYSDSSSDSSYYAGNGGAISFAANSGNITLTNSGLGSNSTARYGNAGNGGAISFATNFGNITLTNSGLESNSIIIGGKSGNGGAISVATNSGNITLIDSSLRSYSSTSENVIVGGYGSSGNGGMISVTTNFGNIALTNSDSNSSSSALSLGSSSDFDSSGNGGAISFATDFGNITLTNSKLQSYSYSYSDKAGNGGTIHIRANGGKIIGNDSTLRSFAVAQKGGSGNGGSVILEASSDISISGLTINTISSGDQTGDVQIKSLSNLLIDQVQILTAQEVEVCLENSCERYPDQDITQYPPRSPRRSDLSLEGKFRKINLDSKGQAGDVKVTSLGNLTFSNSQIQSDTRGSNSAGDINITSSGIINFNNSQITSNTSGIGNSGNINIDAPEVKVTANSQIRAETKPGSTGLGGNIKINAPTAVNLTRENNQSPVISVVTNGAGKSGNIIINTPNLTLSNAAEITATATSTATATEGGSVTLNTSKLNLDGGKVGVFAETNGKAPAGTLNLNPYGADSTLNVLLAPGSVISASTNSSGKGGNFNLIAPKSISLVGQGTLSVETTGKNTSPDEQSGDAGTMTILTENLTLSDGVKLLATTSNTGNGGNIGITANTVNLSQGAQISTTTTGENTPSGKKSGRAGSITIDARDQFTLTGTGSSSNNLNNTGIYAGTGSKSTGNAGDITINAPKVNITANSQIRAETQPGSHGDGGSITINAPTSVALNRIDDGVPVVSVETSGAGKAGNININTPKLTLSNSAKVTATATAASTATEGGSVTLNASNLNLNGGKVGVFAETNGQAPAGTLNLNPYGAESALNVDLTPGSVISASTTSSGKGGNFNLTAPKSISLKGQGELSVKTTGSGDAGNLDIFTQNLTLSDGVQLLATTSNTGNGGNIGITADTINLTERSRISSTTTGENTPSDKQSGRAGNITANVGKQITLTGTGSNFTDLNDTGIYAGTGPQSTGNGGNIDITAKPNTRPPITLRNGAKITVDSEGTGDGGNIKLNTPDRITLDTRAYLNATTTSGNGGNIDIDPDIVLLRRNSQISTSAGKNNGGGNGGNIAITTDFLIGGPLSENNDISANAYSGSGGRVTVNANRIFGFIEAPPGIRNTPLSDLAASSELGVNGTVVLNTLNVDPSQGLGELNLAPVDSSNLIAQSCATGKQFSLNENKFVVTGRSGLPASPEDIVRSSRILTELGTTETTDRLANDSPNPNISRQTTSSPSISPPTMIEAQGWEIGSNGKVQLVAQSTNPPPSPNQSPRLPCLQNLQSLRP
jgi:filamentous hemagglutinin family protein